VKPAVLAAVAAAVYALDQLTKTLVIGRMPLNTTRELVPFFSLTHVQNTGAAFGIYQDGNLFFIITTVFVLGVLAFLHKKLVAGPALNAWGVALLWGGALGNLTDRLRLGAVTDFLDFHLGDWHWPAFNVADSAICVGVGLLILTGFREPAETERTT
jgi:signal peptidase II